MARLVWNVSRGLEGWSSKRSKDRQDFPPNPLNPVILYETTIGR